jgi:FkbM family methyltransferase
MVIATKSVSAGFNLQKLFRRQVMHGAVVEYLRKILKGGPRLRLPVGPEFEINPGDVLIDCGANVGDICSLFARTGATVYAFEPHPACWDILRRRFWMMSNVTCFNRGVMDRDCKLSFQMPQAHEQYDVVDASTAATFTEGVMETDRYSVREVNIQCIDLEKFIKDLGRRVRILKLDVEGSEVAIINKLMDTGTIDQIDLVIAETHDWLMPALVDPTNALRKRIASEARDDTIRLDWV